MGEIKANLAKLGARRKADEASQQKRHKYKNPRPSDSKDWKAAAGTKCIRDTGSSPAYREGYGKIKW